MNILFIYPVFPEDTSLSSLVKDLTDTFVDKGHNVYIATLREKKYNVKTELQKFDGYDVLRVKTGNLFNDINKVEKLFTMTKMPFDFYNAIKKYWGNKKIDLIVTQTPYTSNPSLIRRLKKLFKAPAFLTLFDIFPQNAKDLGLINSKLVFSFFKLRELQMLSNFDYIGCMSPGNLKYMKKHYWFMGKSKFILFYLWGKTDFDTLTTNKKSIRKSLGFSENDFIAVFGGNIGKPQKIENIVSLAKLCVQDKDVKIVFIGRGTEVDKLKNLININNLKNILIIDYIPRDKYNQFVSSSDLGIVSLDEAFTVPNFPSKTLEYMRLGIPIIASLDDVAINDYGRIIENEIKCGFFNKAGDSLKMKENLYKIKNNQELRRILSKNGVDSFKKFFDVENAYNKIINLIS